MKERERVSEKESDIRAENCQLFEAFGLCQALCVKGKEGISWPLEFK